jgi:ABC-type phosphate transport system ATPase subunit
VKMGRVSTERVGLYQGVKDKAQDPSENLSGGKKREVSSIRY